MNSIITREFDDGWERGGTCIAAQRLREALAIIDAINAGELLAALPTSSSDRHRHQAAVTLLDLLERTLRAALSNAPAGGDPCREAGISP